jgi:hypothetical protein
MTTDYTSKTRDLSFEQVRDLGTQAPARKGDWTGDYDQNMNRVRRYYFGTFTPGKLAQDARDRLHALGYQSITIFDPSARDVHHIYVSKDED